MPRKTLAPQPDQVLNTTQLPAYSAPSPQRGKSVRRGGAVGGMDASMGTAKSRRQVQERMGAQRRIEVNLPGPTDPEARATQANGKIVPSVMGQKNNFFGGESASYR